MIIYIFSFLLFTYVSTAQTELTTLESKIMPSDTALYDKYGMSYKISQPLKYGILHASTGAAAAFSLYSVLWVKGDFQDEMGIGFMFMPIVGGSLGLLSGSIYGLFKGMNDEDLKRDDLSFYHKSGTYLYLYGTGFSNADNKFSIKIDFPLCRQTEKLYFPNVLAVTVEYVKWNGDIHMADEFKYGIDGKYYYSNSAFFNSFYGFGFGLTNGKYWNSDDQSYNRLTHNFSYVFLNAYVGCGINVFDLFHINSAIVYEPLNSRPVINPGWVGAKELFMLKLSFGPVSN